MGVPKLEVTREAFISMIF